MHRELRSAIVTVVVVVAVSAVDVFAQEPTANCPEAKYSGRMTSAYRYRVRRIEGQAVYGAVSEKGELQSASGVCVTLFDRKSKRFIASVATEDGGQFKFANLASSQYALVVSLSHLHELIIPVDVNNSPRTKAFKPWGLLLHLRSRDDRKKSFVTPIKQPALREELVKMEREDQAIRNEMIKKGAERLDRMLEERMSLIDARNTARLKQIVLRYGWPGPKLVGNDGANAAFLLLQHSPDLALQQAMLPLVRRSYESGELSAWNYALLQDRVLVREGKPQLYGMSLKQWAGKEPVLDQIEDEANVDKRRAKIGLPPLSEYLEFMKRHYFPKQ